MVPLPLASVDDDVASPEGTCELSEETGDELTEEVGEEELCDAVLSVEVVVEELPVLTLVVVVALFTPDSVPLTPDTVLLTPDVAEDAGSWGLIGKKGKKVTDEVSLEVSAD